MSLLRKPFFFQFFLFLLLSILANAKKKSESMNSTPKVKSASGEERVSKFSGAVWNGKAFEKEIGMDLIFALKPDKTGWTLAVESKKNRDHEYSRFEAPIRGWNQRMVNTDYGNKASDQIANGTRAFTFVLNEEEYAKAEAGMNCLLWPYYCSKEEYEKAEKHVFDKAYKGQGIFKIEDSKVSSPEGFPLGRIDYMRFSIEIAWPD